MLCMCLTPQTDAKQHMFWDQSQAAKHFRQNTITSNIQQHRAASTSLGSAIKIYSNIVSGRQPNTKIASITKCRRCHTQWVRGNIACRQHQLRRQAFTHWPDNQTQDALNRQTEHSCRQTMAATAAAAAATGKQVKNNWSSNDASTGPGIGCLDMASGKSSRWTFNDYQAITFSTLPIPTVFPVHMQQSTNTC